MKRRIAIALAAVASVLCAGNDAGAKPNGQDPNRCTHVEAKPVFKGDGFSHVVRVRNTCTEVVHCEVWTNVDESKTAKLNVPAHAERNTTLRDGSPVSLFRAEGKCSF